jgi:RNA polymerase sigma-70 factor (ECF subfamily)
MAMPTPTDAELVSRAQGGESRAFAELLERHYGTIFRIAFKCCGHRGDAEDIAQNACLRLAATIGQFRFRAAFTTWLYRVVLSAARDFQRRASAQRAAETDYARQQAVLQGPDPPEVTAAELYAAIRQLPEPIREAVLLVVGEGLSHAQAARVLGCAETTVSWRLFQARRRLRRWLAR